MLQSVKGALAIDPDHPWLHQCLVRFFKGGMRASTSVLHHFFLNIPLILPLFDLVPTSLSCPLSSLSLFLHVPPNTAHFTSSSFSLGEQGAAGGGQDGAEAGDHPAVRRQQR